MSTKPSLFSTDMVRAILEDRKTVTRRVVKPQPKYCAMSKAGLLISGGLIKAVDEIIHAANAILLKLPYQPGDILYVRETFFKSKFGFHYKADYQNGFCQYMSDDDRWHPSIHMPKEAARIFLRVTDVRVERLQDMTVEDAAKDFGLEEFAIKAAGIAPFASAMWNTTIKRTDRAIYGWAANPWCWVIQFERISKGEAQNESG